MLGNVTIRALHSSYIGIPDVDIESMSTISKEIEKLTLGKQSIEVVFIVGSDDDMKKLAKEILNLSGKTLKLAVAIKKYRADNKLSQRQFAKVVGMHVNDVNRLELSKNKPQPKTIEKLSKFLGIPAKELVGFAGE